MVRKTVNRRTSQSVNANKKATKTPINTNKVERWTCAFDGGSSDASSLALVRSGINGNKLRIIDVLTGTQRSEYAGEGGAKIKSVAWGQLPGSHTEKQRKKPGTSQVVVAIGLQSGAILMYSPARNSVVKTLEGPHSSQVAAMVFASDMLFSLDINGNVVQWDISTGKPLKQLKTEMAMAHGLLVSSDAQRVVVSSHRIEMWDISRQSRLQAWPGHTSTIHSLLWAADEAALVSAAESDRHVHVWDASPDAAARPRAVLSTDSEILYVDVSPSGSVLAVAEDGILYAWHQVAVAQRGNGSSHNDIGYTADGIVKILSTANPAQTLPILLARFSLVTGNESNVLVVRGSATKPLFETLSLADQDGQFEKELTLSREPQSNLLITDKTEAEKQLAAQLNPYSESNATVTDTVTEGVRKSQQAADEAMSAHKMPSLADRIKQLSVGNDAQGVSLDSSSPSAIAASLKLTAGTLVRVLVQSLHTSDQEMLETVLSNSARSNIVRDTVLNLPTAYVLPFLQQVFERFQTTPSRATQLLPWIRNTLALHSSYLVSIPSLIPQLSGFYQGIEARLETHQNLLKLSGRLELANLQIRARSHYEKEQAKQIREAQSQTTMQPINVYREEEDEFTLSTEPPTPVWRADESTDDEGGSGNEGVSEDEQWKEGSGDEDEEMASADSASDSESDSESDSGSDLDGLE
ncbi:Small subunit (SSU) processome component [Coemansia sp. RSA 990]|nr:WD40-repeat-containing domain protein [Coemansia mojavensis]KAJ1739246.1 Small subunit (SSU) processome component [Coemansia sp. RSA 1086]KAJ1870223.1 Small subunit (SSU) processome component [Coemansia sp. RSA 990]KAJ2668096.1 Small subunit (SSU) processome component [Coemansia sp. RSA 1085]